MRKSIVTVLAAPLFGMLASIATPAAAEESVRVPYGDLDLTSAAGQATLNARIAAAVDKVCSPAPRRDLRSAMAWEECRTLTLADAMEKLAAIEPPANVALAASAEH